MAKCRSWFVSLGLSWYVALPWLKPYFLTLPFLMGTFLRFRQWFKPQTVFSLPCRLPSVSAGSHRRHKPYFRPLPLGKGFAFRRIQRFRGT